MSQVPNRAFENRLALVTGAEGAIGSAVVAALRAAGARVVAADAQSGSMSRSRPRSARSLDGSSRPSVRSIRWSMSQASPRSARRRHLRRPSGTACSTSTSRAAFCVARL